MTRADSRQGTKGRRAGLLSGLVFLFTSSMLHLPLHGQPASISPGRMARLGSVDERFVSYNVEMVEVTGGRFWAPYRSEGSAPPPAQPPATSSMPGLDPNAFRMRPPIDLANARLRGLAKALGPAYVRVSGTWANSTYFHDEDTAAPPKAPEGFGGVLTRAQWRGVVDFAKATDAEIVTSFAISQGVRDASGVWTPVEAQKLLAYTASIGSRIAGAEMFNEPNLPGPGGAPKGYDAAAFGRDFRVFLPFIRKAAPGLLVLGPGSVGEGGLLATYPGPKSEAMLEASGGGVDVFSYHSYNGVSKRCAGLGGGGSTPGQTTNDAALTADWLARTERDARFYGELRDRFAPGKPVWLTESGETACGGNPWASTFTDTFRYVEQLGRLARLGVRVVMHNTLAASDYALVDEETLEPRPSYWAALLWRRLMGTTVLDAGPSPAPNVDVFAHCLAGTPGGVALVAVNADRSTPQSLTLPSGVERYTLSSPTGLLSHRVTLNGQELGLRGDSVPVLRGVPITSGAIALPPASITFLAVPGAGNRDCKGGG